MVKSLPDRDRECTLHRLSTTPYSIWTHSNVATHYHCSIATYRHTCPGPLLTRLRLASDEPILRDLIVKDQSGRQKPGLSNFSCTEPPPPQTTFILKVLLNLNFLAAYIISVCHHIYTGLYFPGSEQRQSLEHSTVWPPDPRTNSVLTVLRGQRTERGLPC